MSHNALHRWWSWRAIVGLLVTTLALTACGPPVIDGAEVEKALKEWAEKIPGQDEPVTAECPATAKAEPDYRFICTLSDSTGTYSVRVTVLNSDGHVEWELLG